MPTDLEWLIERARKHTISADEHDAQVRSFAYGNTHLENEAITREDIDRAVDSLKPYSEKFTRAL
jgi:hypothetical protein